jgi:hypothetical protein
MISSKALNIARLLTITLMIALLTGCFKTPIAYQCPIIILPADPIPEIKKINKKSRNDQVVKAWVATAIQYKNWNEEVRKQIETPA